MTASITKVKLGTLAAELMVSSGATNYEELHYDLTVDGGEPRNLVITVQYVDGKSPHQLRAEAELELEYLRYFYLKSDFGPAHEDVIYLINQEYIKTGKELPEGYKAE